MMFTTVELTINTKIIIVIIIIIIIIITIIKFWPFIKTKLKFFLIVILKIPY